MPTLEWIGKEKVINHHQDVAYRVLERQYSYSAEGQTESDNGSENMIIHGDNLVALKALLPQYEGKIKCIYIDPPYNTGNEKWVYNDNVNDPKMKKWLGDVVGREGEDLSRHDKWLCMMYPRLQLLKWFLTEDGAIFISIDDNELYNLKLICDEIFGSSSFIANIIWQKTYSPRNDAKGIPYETDSVLVYSKTATWMPQKLERTEAMEARHSSPDNDPVDWQSGDVSAAGAADHQGMVYAIQHPITGKLIYPSAGRHWKDEQSQVLSVMNEWAEYELRDIHDEQKRASLCNLDETSVRAGVCAIMLKIPLSESQVKAQQRYEHGNWPAYYFTGNGKGGIRFKNHKKTETGKTSTNLWMYADVGHTDEAKKELKSIFNGIAPLETPKPTRLINRILHLATNADSIVLDSFAGSGTTAHAVLNLNKQDGGNRKFILVETEDYAETITAERVKRVIRGYGEGNSAVEGTGGDFSFYELGDVLLLADGNLNESVGVDRIRAYVYFMETKKTIGEKSPEENDYFLGTHNQTAYYFYYEPETVTTLDDSFLATIRTRADGYLIYADRLALSADDLRKYNIVFKKIPRDISRL
ncbi:MAG: site-specific DNA-methyltransferase [Firmicutes bacterium HGW-Firmicutes-9]|jgi:adenine-specific DNA-methyltransferase|nr:MAG: site-specific DNA-methyltransferase [Firmicutes bacterium HGW-Firmicutes-9]